MFVGNGDEFDDGRVQLNDGAEAQSHRDSESESNYQSREALRSAVQLAAYRAPRGREANCPCGLSPPPRIQIRNGSS